MGRAPVEVRTIVVRSPVSPLDVTTEVITVSVGFEFDVSEVGVEVTFWSVVEVADGAEVSVGSSVTADVLDDFEDAGGGDCSVVGSESVVGESDVTGGTGTGCSVGPSVGGSSVGCVGCSVGG